MRWPFVSRRDRLRREAADWIARLNGPHGDEERAEFERWYHASADHARAYDRLSGLFQAAGQLRRPSGAPAPAPIARPERSGPRRPLGYAFAAAVACAALLAFFLLSARTTMPQNGPGQQFADYVAQGPGNRRILLADGSEVLLSPQSRLEVAIGGSERRLRLERGEARFAVAREERRFIVEASGAEVVARGTVFVVQVGGGRTTVSLIEGLVDVSYTDAAGQPGPRRVARLEPGDRLVVEPQAGRAGAAAPAPPPLQSSERPSLPAMLQFDDVPLAQAVEQVNRHGGPRVRLAESALAGLRITGAFRSGDSSGFAESVAAAFDLELERGSDGSLLLRARTQRPIANN